MQEKAVQYIHEALTATGFAVVDGGVAYQLSPHIWPSSLACGLDWSADRKVLRVIAGRRNAKLLQVMIDGRGPVPLLTMSEDDLARRIEWIVGLRVTAICPLGEPEVAPAPAPAQAGAKVDEPPLHQCLARTQWFEARGLRDPKAADRWPARRAVTDVPRGR